MLFEAASTRVLIPDIFKRDKENGKPASPASVYYIVDYLMIKALCLTLFLRILTKNAYNL
jgi:Fe2+ or Zn2+ uptake regulation protein